MSVSTVLVTGGAGFLGRQITREFSITGARVICVDTLPPENAPAGPAIKYYQLLLPNPLLLDLLRNDSPDLCVHCAGRASVPFSMSDPAALQKLVRLPDGSGLWLTTTRFLTPSGDPLHEKGLEPTVAIEEPEVEYGQPAPTDDPILDKALERVTQKKAA